MQTNLHLGLRGVQLYVLRISRIITVGCKSKFAVWTDGDVVLHTINIDFFKEFFSITFKQWCFSAGLHRLLKVACIDI